MNYLTEHFLRPLMHYVCVAVLMALSYVFIVGPIIQRHETVVSGPRFEQPDPRVQAAQIVADAVKSQALSAALAGQNASLSAAQQTVANSIQSMTGVSSRLAGALAAGLTTAPPQRQVITVGTTAKSTVIPPSPAPDDDAIQRDMKSVLASTTVHTDVSTKVQVSWEDRPFAPIFAVYGSDGGSGAGLVLKKARGLNFDLLALTNKGSFEPGLDFEHVFKGTSASVGIGGVFDTRHRTFKPEVLVGIHF